MSDQKALVNSVEKKGIITIDPEQFIPAKDELFVFDLKPFLFRELILKEQDYRDALNLYDWSPFQNKFVRICCSNNAIIPMWAYMLATASLQPLVKFCMYEADEKVFRKAVILEVLRRHDWSQYRGKRIVIKGCGDEDMDASVYVAVTTALRPIARSIMYGEPCSTVPVFKRTGE